MGKKLELAGQKFTRLTVISEAGRDSQGKVLWLCRCTCGRECVVAGHSLKTGNTKSCGCYQRDRAAEVHTVHGLRNHPLHCVWKSMMKRCGVWKCTSDRYRRNYISRNISVCEEWRDFESFYDWALSHGYAKGLELDRIDNDHGYFPDNCRFVTRKQNVNNRRCTLRLSDGTPLAELCSDLGIATRENGSISLAYKSIYSAYSRSNRIHPELFNALEKDIEKQERLLSQARTIRKEWEAILDELKERFKSLPSISNQ